MSKRFCPVLLSKYAFVLLQSVVFYLLVPVSLSLLLQDDGQILLALCLELRYLLFGLLQLHSHALHLLSCVTDLVEAVAKLVHLFTQFKVLLSQ